MSEIVGIKIKKKKGAPSEVIVEANLIAELGLEGDVFAGKGDRQISLFDDEAKRVNGESKKDGFCISRFSENLLIKDLHVETLSSESKLAIGEAIIQITQVGKECHKECPVFSREGLCDLSDQVAYAKVIKSGKIQVGDRVNKLPR